MTDHELKIYPEYFDAILYHHKRFEVRADDRGFQVGDRINLREWDGAEYTGRRITGRITYILPAAEFPFGIKEGFIVFAFDVEIVSEGIQDDRPYAMSSMRRGVGDQIRAYPLLHYVCQMPYKDPQIPERGGRYRAMERQGD